MIEETSVNAVFSVFKGVVMAVAAVVVGYRVCKDRAKTHGIQIRYRGL